MDKYEQIGNVRGRGLMLGLEFIKEREHKVPLSARQTEDNQTDIATLGLVVYCSRNILGLMPPLIVTEEIADQMVSLIDKG